MHDGDWNTAGNSSGATFLSTNAITYYKPDRAANDSLWYAKDGEGSYNFSLPADCWGTNPSAPLYLKVRITGDRNISYDCFDNGGGIWINLLNHTTTSDQFYEESMNWSVNNLFYNYSLIFKEEETGNVYNFTNHSDSYLDVICPNYGSDRLVLNYNTPINILTREQPTLRAVLDGGQQIRPLKLLESNGSVTMYLIDGFSILYHFTLTDTTSQYSNSILTVKTTVNDSLQTVIVDGWGLNKDIYFSLRNNTPYQFIVTNTLGGVRSFGFISIPPWDTEKKLTIDRIDLGSTPSQYSGGLSFSFSQNYASKTLSLNYNKTDGSVTSVNYSVFVMNQTPYYPLYSTQVYSTQNGILTYVVDNTSLTYFQTVDMINDGKLVSKKITALLLNETARIIDLGIPVTFLGITRTTIYNALSFFILICAGIAFTFINVGIGAIVVVGLGVFFSTVGWLTTIPWYLWTLLFLVALGTKLSERRITT
jgi:hypothetical protein